KWNRSGGLIEETHYKDGIKHGLCKVWEDSTHYDYYDYDSWLKEKEKNEELCENGDEDACEYSYYSYHGVFLYETNYINGVADGTRRGWYKNGQLNYETNKDGSEKRWYRNGQLASWVIGFDRSSKSWYKDGQLKSDYKIVDSVKFTNYFTISEKYEKAWYENGQLKFENYYDNLDCGEKKESAEGWKFCTSKCVPWSDDIALILVDYTLDYLRHDVYRDGRNCFYYFKNVTLKSYFTNSQIENHYIFIDGLIKSYKSYFKNGQIENQYIYKDGLIKSKKEFNEQGDIVVDISY
ncbi:hypothetical protein OAN33_06740, partial [Flavobacteriales bacterium]|nr:hypothetical protein [Flavobacteriales bacterium]